MHEAKINAKHNNTNNLKSPYYAVCDFHWIPYNHNNQLQGDSTSSSSSSSSSLSIIDFAFMSELAYYDQEDDSNSPTHSILNNMVNKKRMMMTYIKQCMYI